jgi:hypothetical protein
MAPRAKKLRARKNGAIPVGMTVFLGGNGAQKYRLLFKEEEGASSQGLRATRHFIRRRSAVFVLFSIWQSV